MAWLIDNFIGVIVVAGLILFYILTYYLNKKTPIPEECLDTLDEASCTSCKNFACTHKR